MKQYSKRMENRIIELLFKLPNKIEHKILTSWFDENNAFIKGWSKEKQTLIFTLLKTDNNLFRAFYRFRDFEGYTRLPLKDEEVKDYMTYGVLLTDPEENTLDIALEKLYNWLLKENLINEKNIEE